MFAPCGTTSSTDSVAGAQERLEGPMDFASFAPVITVESSPMDSKIKGKGPSCSREQAENPRLTLTTKRIKGSSVELSMWMERDL